MKYKLVAIDVERTTTDVAPDNRYPLTTTKWPVDVAMNILISADRETGFERLGEDHRRIGVGCEPVANRIGRR